MPRLTTKRKGRLSTEVRAERSAVKRYRKGTWIDPYPWVQGTLPEKMVYAELSRRGIRFAFQNEINFAIPEIDFNKMYRPDIAIPDLKLIIEVQGSYWHSQEKAIEDDAYKFAVYETTGWRVIVWWDFDIVNRLQELVASEPLIASRSPELANTGTTEYIFSTKRVIDDAKGIKTMNYNRGQRSAYKKPSARVRIKKRRY